MQHKHYFVALLCGALCLTGCLKNEESLSVAEVRNAKANELNASAELKKAQATAETVLANAQAELLKAQAEVEKAQATKIKAEADLVQVQADLLAVEVELAKVSVQSAKIDLEEKKLELAAQEKALELLIAQCDAALETLALELENMKMELEAEKYTQMLALVQAEEAYKDYLAGLEEEDEAAFQAAIAMYFHLQSAILEAEIQINENEIEIAQLNAQEDENYDALLKQYQEDSAELERISAYIEKAQEYLEYDPEELQADLDELNLMLIDAYNEEGDAYSAYYAAYTEWSSLRDAFMGDAYGNFVYRYGEFVGTDIMYDADYDAVPFIDLALALGAYWKNVPVDETEDEWAEVLGYDDPETEEFVPLYVDQRENGPYAFYSPDEETARELEEKGIATDIYGRYTYHYIAAEINVENVNAFIDAKIANEEEEAQALKDEANEQAEAKKVTDAFVIGTMEAQKAEYEAYIEAVKPEFDAAQEAVTEAELNTQLAAFVEALAEIAKTAAETDDHVLERATYEYQQAVAEATTVLLEYNQAKADSLQAIADEQALEAAFIDQYGGADFKEAVFNRDFAIASAHADLEAAQAALTTDIVTEYNTAKNNTAAKEKAYDEAADKVESTLAAYRAAVVADKYHSTAETQKAVTDTEKAYNDAVTALGTAEGERATAWTHYKKEGDVETGDKAEAYNVKNNAIINAQAAYDYLVFVKEGDHSDPEAIIKGWDDYFADANANIVEKTHAAETALEACVVAFVNMTNAEEAFNEATEALAADEKADLIAAQEALTAAQNEYTAANNALAELNVIYPHYATYVAVLDEEGVFMTTLNALKADLEDPVLDYGNGVDEKLSEYLAAIDADLEAYKEYAENVKATVAKYEESYRPAYVEGIEAFNKQDQVYTTTYFDWLTAKAYVAYLEGLKDMLVECTFYDENGNLVNVQDYIDGLQAQYDAIEEALNDAIDAYLYDYDNIYAIQRLELQNEQLEGCIAIWEVELAKYEAIIAEWLAENAA